VSTSTRGVSRREPFAPRHRVTTTVVVLLALCTFIGTRSVVFVFTEHKENERTNMHLATTTMSLKQLAAAPAALSVPTRYTLDDDISNRSARFPSIQERVRLYTSDWYAPPCNNDQKVHYRYSHVPSTSTAVVPNNATASCSRMSTNNSTGNNTANLTNNPSTTIELVVYFYNHRRENETTQTTTTATLHIPSTVAPDELFLLTPPDMTAAAGSRIPNCALYPNMKPYCRDVEETLWPALERVFSSVHENANKSTVHGTNTSSTHYERPPVLLQFGDNEYSYANVYSTATATTGATTTTTAVTTDDCHLHMIHLPVVKKFRRARTREQLAQATGVSCRQHQQMSSTSLQQSHSLDSKLTTAASERDSQHFPTDAGSRGPQPIIWKLNTVRHYRKLNELPRNDIPWDQKAKSAVFRGSLTGKRRHPHHANDDDYTVCHSLDRCRLVYNYHNSTLLSARLTNTFGRVDQMIQGVAVTTHRRLALADMLKFKGIVILEGNDVASGLKWALASRSVVLMPRPMYTSWAMEELLEPWVHYIPLGEDLVDVERKIQWMIDNDEQACQIADRGAMWMVDLVVHSEAAREELVIEQDILHRYLAHFAEHLIQKVLK
jgi:hypothetical protein